MDEGVASDQRCDVKTRSTVSPAGREVEQVMIILKICDLGRREKKVESVGDQHSGCGAGKDIQ